jgi:fumarylacetoacetate (FAA) hydrolase
MKLASLREGRDGRLVVVSRNLERAADASAIAPTLQAALDDWESKAPQLEALAGRLEGSSREGFPFLPSACAAPLPRAYQWVDGSAYVNHVELMRANRSEPLPDAFWRDPLLYQGGSDSFLGPQDPIPFGSRNWGLDFEAEVVVITDDVPMGLSADRADAHIKLWSLANDVSLRKLIPAELATGFGFFLGKPSTAFAPVATTTDELNPFLVDGKLALEMLVRRNGEIFGRARADVDQVFRFRDLIARAATTRALTAGTVVGGGTVSNRHEGGSGRRCIDGGAGYSCIAEQRAVERMATGAVETPWLRTGDRIEIEMLDAEGHSIFGRIAQQVVA